MYVINLYTISYCRPILVEAVNNHKYYSFLGIEKAVSTLQEGHFQVDNNFLRGEIEATGLFKKDLIF